MQPFYETKADRLSKNEIHFLKNITAEPACMTKPHWHNAYEILFVRRGAGEQMINSQKNSFYPGSVTIICPGDIHTTIATSKDGCEIDVLQFTSDYFDSRKDLLATLRSAVISTSTREERELFDKIHQYAYSVHISERLVLSGAVFMLCGILVEHCNGLTSIVTKTKFIKDVCTYLHDADDTRLKAVSNHFGYSCEHFSRKFHAELGISFQSYCEKVKMQKVLKMFDENEIPLSDFAELLGYSDTSSFIRAFKRIYGITPGTYKKLNGELVDGD